MANSADPDQLASSEANWSGSTLFEKAGYIRIHRTRANVFWINKCYSKYLDNYFLFIIVAM